MNKTTERIYKLLSSQKFFYLVLVLFVFQALWLVFSAAYPMAFDEAFHFGVIQIYAQQLTPFLSQHPENADVFSAIHRDGSYLFHYLLSFPYRLIAAFTVNPAVQIILLRIINVALFTCSLVLFRKVFRRVGVSRALTNVSLLLFTLIPIVPLLAAHINYDNLLMVVTAWFLLVSADTITALHSRRFPLRQLSLLMVLALLGSLVKIAILPVVAATGLFITAYAAWVFRHSSRPEIITALKDSFKTISLPAAITLSVVLVISGVLFFERYGLNLINHGTLLPKCEHILTHEQCLEFGPYERNHGYRLARDPDFTPVLGEHIMWWAQGMWYRTFFMINGDLAIDRYHNYPPLPLPALTALAILAAGMLALILKGRDVFKDNPLGALLLLSFVFYAGILWYNNFQSYASLGRAAALNGRYLLIVLLPLAAVFSLALSKLLEGRSKLKMALAVLVITLFLQGGGVTSFIVRSSETWYWPHPTVERINNTTENILHPLIFGSQGNHLHFIKR